MIADRQSALPALTVPIVVGAAAVGGYFLLRSSDDAKGRANDDRAHADVSAGGPPPPPSGRWVYPVPRWNGRAAEISNGFGAPRPTEKRGGIHRGADIMFRRRSLGEFVALFPPRSPHTSRYFMPPGTLVLAAADGEVWSAEETGRGHTVVISHRGTPWATYYTHMGSLRVGETRHGRSNEQVRAGQPLGVVGADPKDQRGIAHLHFEMWFRGNGTASVDPGPYLRTFPVLDAPEAN